MITASNLCAGVEKIDCITLGVFLQKLEADLYGIDCKNYDDDLCKLISYSWLVNNQADECPLDDSLISNINLLVRRNDLKDYSCDTIEEKLCEVTIPCSEILIKDVTPDKCDYIPFNIRTIK